MPKICLYCARFPSEQFKVAPLGIAYIASFLTEIGMVAEEDIRIVDSVKEVLDFAPDILGISSVSQTITYARDFAVRCKSLLGCTTVLGGYHISCIPQQLPNEFDLGVISEGEVTFAEITANFICEGKGFNPENIKGLCYRNNGDIITTPPREFILDLDRLPMPKRHKMYSDQVPIFTSRGCPFKCTFCASHEFWRDKVRFRSAELVVEEISHIVDTYNPAEINILDDLWIANKKRFREIVDGLVERGIPQKVKFCGFCRSNMVTEEDIILFKRMNYRYVRFGAETASPGLLERIKGKGITVEDHQRVIDLCRKHHLPCSASFMFGVPGETKQDIQKTIDFLRKNKGKLNISGFYLCNPIPGTQLWSDLFNEGKITEDLPFEKLQLDFLKPNFTWDNLLYFNVENIPLNEFRTIIEDIKQEFIYKTKNQGGLSMPENSSVVYKTQSSSNTHPEQSTNASQSAGRLDRKLLVNAPQAITDFDPPLFYRNEKWRGGSRSGYLDMKNAFGCLYRTLISNGLEVNLCDDNDADIILNWSGKKEFTTKPKPQIFFEHGWLPRWSYQLSSYGTNARSHVALNYKHRDICESEKTFVLTYAEKLRNIFQVNADVNKANEFRGYIKSPFILVPFQLATDFNLRYSNSIFKDYYSPDPNANLSFAQAIVDYVEQANVGLPIVFKQHPCDKTDLGRQLRINSSNTLLCNNNKISPNELFLTGLCKFVISVNSNTIHEAAVWNIPSVALGTLIWNENEPNRPLPKEISTSFAEEKFFDSPLRVSYLNNLIKNQWHVSDFLNPLIVQELIESKATAVPYDLRQKYGLNDLYASDANTQIQSVVYPVPRTNQPIPSQMSQSHVTQNQFDRQINKLRKDAVNRYLLVAEVIKQTTPTSKSITMLDAFCGNGYGSSLLAKRFDNLLIDAVDGSAEAINSALQNYFSNRINYQQAVFQFPDGFIPEIKQYDYIVSLESIEYIEHDRQFYEFLLSRLKDNGIICLSMPSKQLRDLPQTNRCCHSKYYDLDDIDLLISDSEYPVEILGWYGQDVYRIDNGQTELLDESQMGFKPTYNGQHLIVVLRKQAAVSRASQPQPSPIKLDIGCGHKKPAEGFVGVDIRKFPWVKYTCNAWEINQHVQPGSVDEIYSRHFFEHLTFEQADVTLESWSIALAKGGKLHLIVPDIQYHIFQFMAEDTTAPSAANNKNHKWTLMEHALAGFWGWQNNGKTEVWDVHKSGYDFRLLKSKLIQHGFTDIQRLDDDPWHLNVTCVKVD